MRIQLKEFIKEKRMWVYLLMACMGTYGVFYLGALVEIDHASYSVLGVLTLVVVFWLLVKTGKDIAALPDKRQRRRRCCYAGLICFLFSLSMIMGYQLQMNGMTDCGVKGKGLILLRSVCLAIAFFPVWNLFFRMVERWDAASGKPIPTGKGWKPGVVFCISAAVIFVCLIPVWQAYYPIIMSYDFHRQVNEAAKGFAWFWPYQPIAHTWVIWVFLQLGKRLGDLEAGMAGMALLHMAVHALVAAYAASFIYRITRKKWTVVALVLFFGVFPLNTVMVVCTTKDVLFSELFLLFVLLLAECFFFSQGKKRLILEAVLLVEGCLMIQFRNNAIYAVAVFGICWVIAAPKKEKLRAFLLSLLLVLGGRGTDAAIQAALGIDKEPPKIEMYSVPIQQFARVGYYQAQTMDEEVRQMLAECIRPEYWGDYNAPISDSVKGSGGVIFPMEGKGHWKEFFNKWVTIGMRYPNDFVDAFLELTRGYWFWDDRSFAECLGYGVEERMGILYTYTSSEIEGVGEIEHVSRLPWLEEQLEKVVSGNVFYNWPVISVLFKCAFYFWGLCLMFVIDLFCRRRKQALLCAFPLLYMGTLLLGPVVCIRYIFPVMLTLPVLAALFRIREQ